MAKALTLGIAIKGFEQRCSPEGRIPMGGGEGETRNHTTTRYVYSDILNSSRIRVIFSRCWLSQCIECCDFSRHNVVKLNLGF